MFEEIHGGYYQAVADILSQAVDGVLTYEGMLEAVRRYAFDESVLTIPRALKSGRWPLLLRGYRTPLAHRPSMPLTTLQKRWLKTLLQDPRIRMFGVTDQGLEDVQPLYHPDAVVWYDRYTDADPYEDAGYIECFSLILAALRENRAARICFEDGKGIEHTRTCRIFRLEYSAKDDKFRALCKTRSGMFTVNISRIRQCELLWEGAPAITRDVPKETAVLLLADERNALERVMLHFSHLEKETRRLDDGRYEIRLRYETGDETEMLIRILSFGPVLEVKEPAALRHKTAERILRQAGMQAK